MPQSMHDKKPRIQSTRAKTGQAEDHTLESEKRHVGALFNREERGQTGAEVCVVGSASTAGGGIHP